jgi:hypothetical protein
MIYAETAVTNRNGVTDRFNLVFFLFFKYFYDN